jgi:hypothetical protein
LVVTAAVGVDHVVIYKFGDTQNDQHNMHILGVNSDLDFRMTLAGNYCKAGP